MDAVKFLKELQRICSGRTTCRGCDLYASDGKGCKLASNPDKWVKDEIERLILIVEKLLNLEWRDER